MIATKSKSAKSVKARRPRTDSVGNGEILTLAELARYLRIAEGEVVRLARDEDLPGRLLGAEWRFLKSAVQDWLKSPPKKSPQGIWAWAGAWKDDPYLDEMLKEIYRKRGRPMTEEE